MGTKNPMNGNEDVTAVTPEQNSADSTATVDSVNEGQVVVDTPIGPVIMQGEATSNAPVEPTPQTPTEPATPAVEQPASAAAEPVQPAASEPVTPVEPVQPTPANGGNGSVPPADNQPPVGGQQPGMGMNNQPPKKSKAPLFIILGVVGAIILAAIVGVVLFLSMARTEINPFDYADFEIVGVSGGASVDEEINNYTDDKNINELMDALYFSIDNDYNLKNGDVVTITVDPEDPAFDQFGFTPTQTTLTISVEDLAEIPATWEDVPEKDKIMAFSDEPINDLKEEATKHFKNLGQSQFGEDIDLTVDTKLVAVAYKPGNESLCNPNQVNSLLENCGTAVMLYDYKMSVPSPYYITGSDSGSIVVSVTGITAKDGKLQDGYDEYINYSLKTYPDNLDAAKKYLEEKGYVIVYQ
ncbi:hypothetical protein [Culicoidibacter larvae]|uniref:Uncharacterized protein n=1 Tax=Culicoidibacter larvae TaxID=2579976 RepID=A0A5R8QFE5_9FIRM|nr:hypothetical protein [Culicoidibacter larvae]TLG76759.1 hypothetical protein FEZ08_03850 [Culicoidibacter larvae]